MGRRQRHSAPTSASDVTPDATSGAGGRRPRRVLRWLLVPVVALAVLATLVVWPHRLGSGTGRSDSLGVALPSPDLAAMATPSRSGRLDPARVARALAPVLRAGALGPRVLAGVDDLDGTSVLVRGPSTITPASTTKLLTSLAALDRIAPGTRFRTRTVLAGSTLTLVGGGDPLLASTPQKDAWPARADVVTLARSTARALQRQGVARVRLAYDAGLFTGPAINPAWPATYSGQPGGYDVVSPISALWVDEGRVAPGDARRTTQPARAAADAFARALADAGVTVTGSPVAGTAPDDATPLASVASAPVADQVEHLLLVSDNEAAEVMLRQVALAAGRPGSSADGVRAVRATLARLDVPAPAVLGDGSGLSRRNRLGAGTLLGVLHAAATASADSPLRALLSGLPVAGLTGSLASRFGTVPASGRGVVRAKTGTLTGVSGLAGVGADAQGTPFLIAVVADRISPPSTLEARAALDRALAAVARCRCTTSSAG